MGELPLQFLVAKGPKRLLEKRKKDSKDRMRNRLKKRSQIAVDNTK